MAKHIFGFSLLVWASFACGAQSGGIEAEQNAALEQIRLFNADMGAADPRYAEIEKKLLPFIGDVVRNYPPQYWLSIIKLLYQVRATP